MKKQLKQINIKNKRASYEYEFIQKYTAGMVLTGTEIKSIRQGKVSINESYCYFKKSNLFIKNMHIAPYEHGNIYNHDEIRERKLLLKNTEIRKLEKTKEKGLTIIPLRLFINDRGLAKLEISLAKGKKLYDKRQSLKEKDIRRQLQISSKKS